MLRVCGLRIQRPTHMLQYAVGRVQQLAYRVSVAHRQVHAEEARRTLHCLYCLVRILHFEDPLDYMHDICLLYELIEHFGCDAFPRDLLSDCFDQRKLLIIGQLSFFPQCIDQVLYFLRKEGNFSDVGVGIRTFAPKSETLPLRYRFTSHGVE